MSETSREHPRAYIYELDPLRAITALCVVAVHVFALTTFLNGSNVLGTQIQNAIVTALHYTREMFLFMTSFALVSVYYGKPFSTVRFWKKRSLGVLLPYCLWSLLYTWLRVPNHAPGQYIPVALSDILTGTASYQLYYILLSLQVYLLLPFILVFIKHVARHPWLTLTCSFTLQVVLLYLDYHYLQATLFSTSGIGAWIVSVQDRVILAYQFYVVLGALTALYFQQIRVFLARSGRWIVGGFVAALALLWGHFFVQVDVLREPLSRAVVVLQPVMTFYSLTVILLGLLWACRWARKVDAHGHPRGYRLWRTLSNASFGLYLVHPLFLTLLLNYLVPIMPAGWPVALRVFLVWLLTAGSAVIISVVLMNIPIVSRLVGRSKPLPRAALKGATRAASTSHLARLEIENVKNIEHCEAKHG